MAKHGRILFYDTRDGVVFYDSGEMEGNILPPDPETYYKIFEEKYGNRNNIAHLQLEFGQYKEEFSKFSHCCVSLPGTELWFSQREKKYNVGAKSTLNDRFWPLFENLYDLYDDEKKTVNYEKIHKFYDDYINFNLRGNCEIAEPIWLPIDRIGRFSYTVDSHINMWDNGAFGSLEDFALELLNEGFSLPMHVTWRENIYKIYDGRHRIEACKYLDSLGKWPTGKKILCIAMDAINIKFIEDPSINYGLGHNVVMHVPTKSLPKYGFIKYVSKREYDEDITEVEIDRYLDLITIGRLYMNEMSRTIIKYKQFTGKALVNPIINDEKLFMDWIKK
jgi:uncharacterized protein YqgQ